MKKQMDLSRVIFVFALLLTSKMEASDLIPKFKVITVGSAATGKTSLLKRHHRQEFVEKTKVTMELDQIESFYEIKGKTIAVGYWDTVGQERFRAVSRTYYRGAQGIVMVYDVTNRASFEAIDNFWAPECSDFLPGEFPILYLVGNKSDLHCERQVSHEEGRKLAKKLGAEFFETSAKTDWCVDALFTNLTTALYRQSEVCEKQIAEFKKEYESIQLQLTATLTKHGKCCS